MEGYRGQTSFRNPGHSGSLTSYFRRTADLPFTFTERNPDVSRGRNHNPNDSLQGWNTDAKSSRVLISLENNNFQTAGPSNPLKEVYEDKENLCKPNVTGIKKKMQFIGNSPSSQVDYLPNQRDEEKRAITKRISERRYFDVKIKQPGKDFQSRRREHQFRILTGPVEKILYWSKLKNKLNLLFEVFALLTDVRNGAYPTEKSLTLRDEISGPSLIVLYYEIDRPLPSLTPGRIVRCVGTLKSRNILQAFKVEESSELEKARSQRLFFISNMAAEESLSLFLKK